MHACMEGNEALLAMETDKEKFHARMRRSQEGTHLAGDGGDDGLRVHQAGVAQVVQAAAAQDLRARLPPHRLAELRARSSERVSVSDSKSS